MAPSSPLRPLHDDREALAKSLAVCARRLWRRGDREDLDNIVLDLVVEALHRLGNGIRPKAGKSAAAVVSQAPLRVQELLGVLQPLAARALPQPATRVEPPPSEEAASRCKATFGSLLAAATASGSSPRALSGEVWTCSTLEDALRSGLHPSVRSGVPSAIPSSDHWTSAREIAASALRYPDVSINLYPTTFSYIMVPVQAVQAAPQPSAVQHPPVGAALPALDQCILHLRRASCWLARPLPSVSWPEASRAKSPHRSLEPVHQGDAPRASGGHELPCPHSPMRPLRREQREQELDDFLCIMKKDLLSRQPAEP